MKKKKPEWIRNYYWKAKRERPWVIHLSWARSRCTSKNHPYFKKGIRVFLTVPETKKLWDRDNAWTLARPSLGRINTANGYTLENCRFIELADNQAQGRENRWAA